MTDPAQAGPAKGVKRGWYEKRIKVLVGKLQQRETLNTVHGNMPDGSAILYKMV